MDLVAWRFRCLLLLAVVLTLAVVTFAAPAANLVPSLPGQPGNAPFNQYAGYITVNQTLGKRLFYYFAEAQNSSSTRPLVLWLNGGPGCSSLTGGFTELGPFYPNASGNGLDVNNNSWNKVAHVIFLESPAGVGFSYANDSSAYLTDDKQTAQDALTFLLGWLAEYPEYNSTDFYITGESYAGHYAPQLAAAILENNEVSGQVQIPLKGVMIGNPLFDIVIDGEYSPLEFGWQHGMMSEATHNKIVQDCNFTSHDRGPNCSTAKEAGFNEMGLDGAYINPYDVLADVCLAQGAQATGLKAMFDGISSPDPCIVQELVDYLNDPDVQNALHVEVPTDWQQCWGYPYYNASDGGIPISPILADLVNSNLTVWIYSGDLDTVVSLIGTRKIIAGLAESLNWNITSDYSAWFQGSQVGGWSLSWGPSESLVYSTVRGGSHMVPATQPARSLVLFKSFLAGDPSPPLVPT